MRSPRGRQQDRCLGDLAAALTDGELGSDARDAALAHLVHCDTCRDDVAGQRSLKTRLRDLSDPAMPAGLLDRLVAMSDLDGSDGFDSGAPSGELELVGAAPRHRVALPPPPRRVLGRSDRLARARAHVRVPRGVRYAMAGGASVLALGVSAFALGGSPQNAPTVVPRVGSFTMENASVTNGLPFNEVSPTATFKPVLVGATR